MKITTMPDLPGYEIIEVLDVVRGSTVRARHVGSDIHAAFKNLVGGEVTSYTELMSDAREQALDRMLTDAQELGADAVVNLRFMTAMVLKGASEILAYGTAVKIRKTENV
jgi:uncharacterized protein YbjQ (UPF0145 family)